VTPLSARWRVPFVQPLLLTSVPFGDGGSLQRLTVCAYALIPPLDVSMGQTLLSDSILTIAL